MPSDTYFRPTASIAPITDGIFFTRPGPLPRGPHRLTRAELGEMYRERYMIAFTELIAAHGYSHVRISDIVAHSGTSKSAFYQSFGSIEDCAQAAYNRFVEVLLANLGATLGNDAIERGVISLLTAYLQTLQEDVVVARAFQLELYNDSRQGRAERRLALVRFAELVKAEHLTMAREDKTASTELPIDAYLGIIYAVRQLASDALDTAKDPDLVGMIPRIREWITASLRNPSHS
ncbi:TetR/AcrR family transcriptional regulator [Gordonia effusa]|uniref:TetR/AcrR family transcriptional regulator n=1 Tax=Gordonia effusa TaxID=263908 RepID=UPI0014792DF2|nr:TetR/AcrR family transcriptional regulator [Gordonia effusa]